MSFTSIEYYFFLLFFFIVYWKIARRFRNHLLLIASIFFYASFSLKGLAIISVMIVGTFVSANRIENSIKGLGRNFFFCLGLFLNLGILFYFKYMNFFLSQAAALISKDYKELSIVIPVGISFCTFQSMSYLIDVYRGKPVEKSILLYAQYIAFFPLVLAGPIERAHQLIRQFREDLKPRIHDGLHLICLGLLKKLVAADNLRIITSAFLNSTTPIQEATPFTLILMGYAFALQYYFDFSAYSDIARGTGFLFGIKLNVNFRFPFIALSPRTFWNAWHITLGRWFRDYVHIPLLKTRLLQNQSWLVTIITFTLIGLWHGASWNFVIFGLTQGLWYLIFVKASVLFRPRLPSYARFLSSVLVMNFIFFSSGLIFALTSLHDLLATVRQLTSQAYTWTALDTDLLKSMAFYVVPISLVEIFLQEKRMPSVSNLGIWQQTAFYCFSLYAILIFGDFSVKEFLYFNF